MVTFVHALQAGMRILQQGGNAADAAVAIAAALNVTEPCMTGMQVGEHSGVHDLLLQKIFSSEAYLPQGLEVTHLPYFMMAREAVYRPSWEMDAPLATSL